MFQKTNTDQKRVPSQENDAQKPQSAHLHSHLSEDLVIEGSITSKGHITLAGTLNGDIICADLSVTDTGRLTGKAQAQNLSIAGTLQGEAQAHSLAIKSTAQAKANITAKKLSLEAGSTVQGHYKIKP